MIQFILSKITNRHDNENLKLSNTYEQLPIFEEKKWIINFMKVFEMRKFFAKINNFKNLYKKMQIYKYSEIIGNTHLFPLHNEPSLMPVGWKLWKE